LRALLGRGPRLEDHARRAADGASGTSSRSDGRSVVELIPVAAATLSLVGSMGLFLAPQFRNNDLELIEASVPELAVPVEPCRCLVEAAGTESAGSNSANLLRRNELRVLQDAHVLPHAREGHVEGLGQIRDRRVGATQPLKDAAPGGVRECCEGGVELA